jgi:hypothetical protein
VSRGTYRESESVLPPLFPLRGYAGSLQDYIDDLWGQYRRVVGDGGVRLWGKPVVSSGRAAADGRDKRFWHVITDVNGDCGGRRALSLQRCEWLPRCLSTLEAFAAGSPMCISWREGRKDVNVVSSDFATHLVLRESATCFGLAAAYPVNSADRAGRMMDRAAAFWLSGRVVRSPRMTGRRLLVA